MRGGARGRACSALSLCLPALPSGPRLCTRQSAAYNSSCPTSPPAVVHTPFTTIVYVVLLVCAQHIIYLIFNFIITTWVLK